MDIWTVEELAGDTRMERMHRQYNCCQMIGKISPCEARLTAESVGELYSWSHKQKSHFLTFLFQASYYTCIYWSYQAKL